MNTRQLLISLFACLFATTAWAEVEINETNFPDFNFRSWVLKQDYGKDGVLTDDELKNVTYIGVNEKRIESLKGIEYFTGLTTLYCTSNKLTELDLSENTGLTTLYCNKNELTELDLSKHTALKELYCGSNKLTALDLSNNTALTKLECYSNQLTALDVTNNTALELLICYYNNLTTLDVSKNTALTKLECYSNQLTALDLSKNTALVRIDCSGNELTILNVRTNTALTQLLCGRNSQLTKLTVSGNKTLQVLQIYGCSLTELDVSGCSALMQLHCNENKLTSLNVRGCTALWEINCYRNQIKGAGMDALVESLPQYTKKVYGDSNGRLAVIYGEDEQNVMTIDQVATARTKGWMPKLFDTWGLKDYEGIDPVGIKSVVRAGEDCEIHNLSGQRITRPRKGLFITGGRKIVVQ